MWIGRTRTTQGRVGMASAASTTYGETVLSVIAREYGPLRHASKILAQHARSSYRTAEGWLSGRNVPTGENLVNLLASCDVLADEMNRLIEKRKKERGDNETVIRD